MKRPTGRARSWRFGIVGTGAALLAASCAWAEPMAGGSATLLEYPAPRHANLDTAAVLPRNSYTLEFGSHQTAPGTGLGGGTGTQVYHGGLDWRGSGRLQFGVDVQAFDDPPLSAIRGATGDVALFSAGASAKYQVLRSGRLSVAAQAGLDYFAIRPGGLNGSDDWVHGFAASLDVPASFQLGPELALHLVPGVTVFPDRLEGYDFYGTNFSLGAGATWQPTPRLQAYGGVTASLGPGGNTIEADGDITRTPVWTAGLRYAVTPRLALDAFATNGLGMSPATDLVTMFPAGDEPLFGLKLTYAPAGRGTVPDSYGAARIAPPTARERQLQRDGFTLSSADVLHAGEARLHLGIGSDDNAAAAVYFSPDHQIQLEAVLEDYADDGSVGADRNPSEDARYMLGGRLQLLDQYNGDAFSLSARLLAGRDIERPTVGVLYAGLSATRDLGDRTAVTANLRAAAFGDEVLAGLGFGVNHALSDSLALVGEATPVSDGETPVWALGARYSPPGAAASLDLYATNAIGRFGLGTLVAQDGARIGLGVSFESRLFAR